MSEWAYGAAGLPEPLTRSDAWSARLHAGGETRIAAAREIEAAFEAFKLEPEPPKGTAERWEYQARIHCLNYANREIKVTDPLFGEGAPFGLPWGLIAGRARLDAIECFKLAALASQDKPHE